MAGKKPIGPKTIRAQYYRSFVGSPESQKEIVRSLGFTRVGQVLDLPANRSTFSTLQKVPHLIRIIE